MQFAIIHISHIWRPCWKSNMSPLGTKILYLITEQKKLISFKWRWFYISHIWLKPLHNDGHIIQFTQYHWSMMLVQRHTFAWLRLSVKFCHICGFWVSPSSEMIHQRCDNVCLADSFNTELLQFQPDQVVRRGLYGIFWMPSDVAVTSVQCVTGVRQGYRFSSNSRYTAKYVSPTLGQRPRTLGQRWTQRWTQCWFKVEPIVCDAGSTFNQHWVSVSYLLGLCVYVTVDFFSLAS